MPGQWLPVDDVVVEQVRDRTAVEDSGEFRTAPSPQATIDRIPVNPGAAATPTGEETW